MYNMLEAVMVAW